MSRPTFYVSQDSSDSYDCPNPEIKVSIQDDKDQHPVSSSQKCPKHRKHLRRHRLPAAAKTKLEVRSPSVQEIKLEFLPKKNSQRSKHKSAACKSRRSHSITTQPNEIEVLKNWKIQNPDKAVPVGVSAGAGLKAEGNTHAADNALPRTLSTSVLRIKHRRTFWERFARHGEDLIVTPFAQILASLRSVRNNYIQLNHSSLQK